MPFSFLSLYPSLIFSFILFNVSFEIIKFDEEFVIFLTLLIVFLTLVENLGNSLKEQSFLHLSKLKNIFKNKCQENFIFIEEQIKILFFLNEFNYEIAFFIIKIQRSFINFISYDFYLTELYLNILVKETLCCFELLEINAIKYYEILFNKILFNKINKNLQNKILNFNKDLLEQVLYFISKK